MFNSCLEGTVFFPILCEGNVYIMLEKTCSNVIANKQEREDGLSFKQNLLSVFCLLKRV